MSKESQVIDDLENTETVANNEISQNPMTVSVEGKILKSEINDKRLAKEEIRRLKEEIENITLADSKVRDAELRGIPQTAITDDVSHAGLSIEERIEKINTLKNQKEGPVKKLRKVLGTLFSF